MKTLYHKLWFLVLSFTVLSCSSQEESDGERLRKQNQKGEYIYRTQNEHRFIAEDPKPKLRELYPWEASLSGKFPKITKEFFRCKGSVLNPPRVFQKKGRSQLVIMIAAERRNIAYRCAIAKNLCIRSLSIYLTISSLKQAKGW